MEIAEKVIRIIEEISDKRPILYGDALQNDIALDSLSMVILLVTIEESFSIELKESDMNPFDLVTVQDVIDMVEGYCGGQDE